MLSWGTALFSWDTTVVALLLWDIFFPGEGNTPGAGIGEDITPGDSDENGEDITTGEDITPGACGCRAIERHDSDREGRGTG